MILSWFRITINSVLLISTNFSPRSADKTKFESNFNCKLQQLLFYIKISLVYIYCKLCKDILGIWKKIRSQWKVCVWKFQAIDCYCRPYNLYYIIPFCNSSALKLWILFRIFKDCVAAVITSNHARTDWARSTEMEGKKILNFNKSYQKGGGTYWAWQKLDLISIE